MKFEVSVVSASGLVRTIEAVNLWDAKSLAMHINKAKHVIIRFHDGQHIVAIQKFPTANNPDWTICESETAWNRQKNRILLKNYRKSKYAK